MRGGFDGYLALYLSGGFMGTFRFYHIEVYNSVITGRIPFYRKACCDFAKLERKCRNYNPDYKPLKKQ